MSDIVVYRDGFLPSEGDAPVEPPFDTDYWEFVDGADRIAGLFDIKSDTAFADVASSQHYSGIPNYYSYERHCTLFRQYVFPEFGDLYPHVIDPSHSEYFSVMGPMDANNHRNGGIRAKVLCTLSSDGDLIVCPTYLSFGLYSRIYVVDSSGNTVGVLRQGSGNTILSSTYHPTLSKAVDWGGQNVDVHVHPAPTDRMAFDLGYWGSYSVWAAPSPKPEFDFSATFTFGDEAGVFLPHWHTENYNPGFTLITWAASLLMLGGPRSRMVRALSPRRFGLHMQHPKLPPTGDFFGEEILG